MASRCAAIKLGTESLGPIRRVRVADCIVRGSEIGLALYLKDQGSYEDVALTGCTVDTDGPWALVVDAAARAKGQERTGRIVGVDIDGCRFRGGRAVLRALQRGALRGLRLFLPRVCWVAPGQPRRELDYEADVLAHLPEAPRDAPLFAMAPSPEIAPLTEITQEATPGEYGELIDLIGMSPISVDDLLRRCHLSPPALQAALADLELEGRVDMQPGHRVALSGKG
jgi:hypothetical protein